MILVKKLIKKQEDAKSNLDYSHGTGHELFFQRYEGPQSISK